MKLNASHSGVEVNNDELFLQAAGGVNKKGLVYGFENHTQAYYERVGPPTPSSLSTPTSYTLLNLGVLSQKRGGELWCLIFAL